MPTFGSCITVDGSDSHGLYGSPASLTDIFSGKVQATGPAEPFLNTVEKDAEPGKGGN